MQALRIQHASADGRFSITIKDNIGTLLSFVNGVYTGVTDEPCYDPVIKVKQKNTVAINAKKIWSTINIAISYYAKGPENIGTDTLTLYFEDQIINTSNAELITSILSGPTEQNSVTKNFNASTDGVLIAKATQTGYDGGGHSIYIDVNGVGYVYTGSTKVSEYTIYPVKHEDDYWPDNSGTRAISVYYLAEQSTSGIIVTLSNITLAPNESTTVLIKILNVSLVDSSGLGYAKISFYYDPAIVNVTNVANGENGFETLTYYKGIGKVTRLGSGTSGVKGNDIEFANLTL
ncbi:MAG: hypothetical protein ACE5KT_11540 [Methanosarcinales archaeon]